MENYKKSKTLDVLGFSNGVILPQKLTDDGPMWGLGGVCDSNNEFVEASFYDGGWAKHGGFYSWEKENYIDEEVIYIGMFYLHWGHFLVDLTNRLWYLSIRSQKDSNFKVAYLGDEEPKGNNLRFFEMLGISENQLIHITEPTRFKKVLVPQQGFKSCEWYTDEFLQMFDLMCDKVKAHIDRFDKLKDFKKIYFTRRSFSKAQSSEFGEEYFEECFNKSGYTSVAPETLSLEEQIFVWNNADDIICMNGTIPLNVVFSQNKNLRLTVLNKTSIPHDNPIILLHMRGITADFVNIYKEPFKKYPKSLGEGPFLLDAGKEFQDFCKIRGIVSPFTDKEKKQYFKRQKRKYVMSIISLTKRLKILLYNIRYKNK